MNHYENDFGDHCRRQATGCAAATLTLRGAELHSNSDGTWDVLIRSGPLRGWHGCNTSELCRLSAEVVDHAYPIVGQGSRP